MGLYLEMVTFVFDLRSRAFYASSQPDHPLPDKVHSLIQLYLQA